MEQETFSENEEVLSSSGVEESEELTRLSVRGVRKSSVEVLRTKAAQDGKPLETWLREQIELLATQPTVKARYQIKARGPRDAFVQIKRGHDGHVQRGARNCSQAQFEAYQRACDYVERNRAGDREKAVALLESLFDEVFEQ